MNDISEEEKQQIKAMNSNAHEPGITNIIREEITAVATTAKDAITNLFTSKESETK
jgi:hypothetical protein